MKKVNLILSAVVMTAIMLSSCGGGQSNEEGVSTVTIGKQVWMTENLDVDKFRNGDPIPQAKSKEEWDKANSLYGGPAWCYYNNDSTNGEKYGKLYNWFAIDDPRGLAPKGWKIPTSEDWGHLIEFLGGDRLAGKKLKHNNSWADWEGKSCNGNNESGFAGLPGGGVWDWVFIEMGSYGKWWSSNGSAYMLSCEDDKFFAKHGIIGQQRGNGFSVRCIKD